MSEDEAEPIDDRGDELDGLRIRQLAALKRGAFRARSFALIGVVTSIVAAIKLVLMTLSQVRTRGWSPSPIGFALFAIVALMLAGYFARRVKELQREIDAPPTLPPMPPEGPDFSTLSDGSQQWKNLEEIR